MAEIIPNLPTAIITDEIFSKLPAKSLMRFKCISKSYNKLISSPEFIDLHLRQSNSSNSNRVLILSSESDDDLHRSLYSIDDESITKIPLPYNPCDWTYSAYPPCIVGSFNGLLCVGLRGAYEYQQFIINPCTGVYREIPPSMIPSSEEDNYRVCFGFGFGFDSLNNDYKVVGIVDTLREPHNLDFYSRMVAVYSFNENSWKLVENTIDRTTHLLEDNDQTGVLMNDNLLHWVYQSSSKFGICCFDVRTDKWAKDVPLMELSEPCWIDHVFEISLGVVHGCLCASTYTRWYQVVWIMKEYGVKESWVKMFDILNDIGPEYLLISDSYGFFQESEHEVLAVCQSRSHGLYLVDIRSDTLGRTTREIFNIPFRDRGYFLKGSLVPIPNGRQMKECSTSKTLDSYFDTSV